MGRGQGNLVLDRCDVVPCVLCGGREDASKDVRHEVVSKWE